MLALGLAAALAFALASELAFGAASARSASGGAGLGSAHHRANKHHRATRRRPRSRPRSVRGNPLRSRAMWIWELDHTDGGDVSLIVGGARYYHVTTVMIKSSDGTAMWPQFTSTLVHELHAAGIHVCAWQYVYGDRPGVEANLGADAVSDGADCLIIDAESEYEGKYVAAQSYVRDLRKQIGSRYAVALAGFPYIDFHPGFPYSVFLGPGGAQDNVPQMYWRDIGTTVDNVFAHTYEYNDIYRRPIFPLGQVYSHPPARQIVRFRELSKVYGAGGVSWWDWQESGGTQWSALARPAGGIPGYAAVTAMAPIGLHSTGDLVVWAQEHLISAGEATAIDGDFGKQTRAAVEAFQLAHGLTADGVVGDATWRALLRYRPVRVTWVHQGRRTVPTTNAVSGDTTGARRADAARNAPRSGTQAPQADVVRPGARTAHAVDGGAPLTLPVPRSASRPAKRDEIPSGIGAGRH